ncbi:hypothetical protein H257_10381 [Aphanomyces astaci]|uniref:Uncharacterized protein n=1 Tax=Aphanomyces astaci TaxID=112090 RepID=W4G7Z6_APHAT|nr:hypothetical protein H257_10381 [Aphanomyces astaci]ETV75164.1 hypothetical protein H257_10381 [Aphanomyces astaci]|eukprot:XP_009835212.1 hypothetical protein H257_10381 [Aphanomyces astaci]
MGERPQRVFLPLGLRFHGGLGHQLGLKLLQFELDRCRFGFLRIHLAFVQGTRSTQRVFELLLAIQFALEVLFHCVDAVGRRLSFDVAAGGFGLQGRDGPPKVLLDGMESLRILLPPLSMQFAFRFQTSDVRGLSLQAETQPLQVFRARDLELLQLVVHVLLLQRACTKRVGESCDVILMRAKQGVLRLCVLLQRHLDLLERFVHGCEIVDALPQLRVAAVLQLVLELLVGHLQTSRLLLPLLFGVFSFAKSFHEVGQPPEQHLHGIRLFSRSIHLVLLIIISLWPRGLV